MSAAASWDCGGWVESPGIPIWRGLGVNAVELQPVQEFDCVGG